MKNYIRPPRLSTAFSKSGMKAKRRFDNILDMRGKKRGAAAIALAAALTLMLGGCFAKEKTAAPAAEEKSGINVVIAAKDAAGNKNELILLCGIDDGTAKITQIPRDTFSGFNGAAKIGDMPQPEQIMLGVEEVTGEECDKYIVVNFDGLKKIADEAGGIDIDIPASAAQYFNLNAGEQHLDGGQIDRLMRYRGENTDDGAEITAVQRSVYPAVMRQIFKSGTLKKLPEIIAKNTETNLSVKDIAKIIAEALKIDPDNIEIRQLEGAYNDDGVYMPANVKEADAPSIYSERDTVYYSAAVVSARVNGRDYDITDGFNAMTLYNKRLNTAFIQCGGNYGGGNTLYVCGTVEGGAGELEISERRNMTHTLPVINSSDISVLTGGFPEEGGLLTVTGADSDTVITVNLSYDAEENKRVQYDVKINSARINGVDYDVTDSADSTAEYSARLGFMLDIKGTAADGTDISVYGKIPGKIVSVPGQKANVRAVNGDYTTADIAVLVSGLNVNGGEINVYDTGTGTRITAVLTPR